MRSKVFCLVFLALCVQAQSLYFMPNEQKQALKSLIQTINSTQMTLDIAIYSFTNREIAKAIRDVAKKGIKVRIIYDKSANEEGKQSTISYLAKLRNIQACLLQGRQSQNGKYYGLMHSKMAISDHKNLILGSANWSKNAFENNYETLLITQDLALIQKAKKEFESLFRTCEKY